MSRDYLLEISIPSQHFVFVGGFRVRRFVLLLHSLRVDAQRKCDGIRKVQSEREPLKTGGLLSPNYTSYSLSAQLSDVMAGTAYLHGLDIVHGDLKGVCTTLLLSLL